MKIGMYTEDEILEYLTEGEGRGFLGRSMYDAIFDKIHTLITEDEQLKEKIKGIQEERDYLFNKSSIENKYLVQENQKYKEVIDKAIEYIKEKARNNCWIDQYESCNLIKILKGDSK